MEKITINLLKYCPYCVNLTNLLDKLKIKYTKNIINENDKSKYKNEIISTFPQVYYHYKNKKYLIGGSDDTTKIINYIIEKKDPKNLPLNYIPNSNDYKIKLRFYTFIINMLNI